MTALPLTVAEYNARITEIGADWTSLQEVAITAAVLAERARNLAGVRPDMAGAS